MPTRINQLDPSQENILNEILSENNNNNISVIYGPPGTGKSHLIVSMLFELAVRNKKVLFVSQNTEALDVITRMVKKLEKDLFDIDSSNGSNNYISITDFFLTLTNKDCRTKKYLRETYNRLNGKSFPKFKKSETDDSNGIHYDLSYTFLDKEDNTKIENNTFVGMDELVYNFIKNVGEDDLPYVPIKSLNKIEIRKIFSLLNSFDDKNDLFESNNYPTSVLKFLSKTNFDIEFGKIQDTVSEFIDVIEKIKVDNLKNKSIKDTNVISLLLWYEKFIELNKIFNIKSLQNNQKNIKIDSFLDSLNSIKELNNKIEDVIELNGIEELDTKILTNINKIFLKDNETINLCSVEIKLALELIQSFINKNLLNLRFNNLVMCTIFSLKDDILYLESFCKSYNIRDEKHINTNKLKSIISIIEDWKNIDAFKNKFLKNDKESKKTIVKIVLENVEIFSRLAEIFNSEILGTLIDKIREYNNKNVIIRWFCKFELTPAQLDFFRALFNVLPIIYKAHEILKDTNYSMSDLYGSCYKGPAYNPLSNFNKEDKISILNKSLKFAEICEKYNIQYKDVDIEDIARVLIQIDKDFNNYYKVLKQNPDLTKNIDFVELINKNINNKKIKNEIIPLINKYCEYIYSSNDRNYFIEKLNNLKSDKILGFLEYRNQLEVVINNINIEFNNDIDGVDTKLIDNLISLLTDNEFMFSKDFFNVKKDTSIYDWYTKLNKFLEFSNLEEFDSFIKQHKFLYEIKQLLTKSNEHLVDDFLKNDNVSYKDFCKKISHDLIKAKYNNTSAVNRKRIEDDYFIEYKNKLKKIRKNYLLKGLSGIYDATENARYELKLDYNWIPADNSVDRFMLNTKKIINTFPVVIATSNIVSRFILPEKNIFDYVIFDEASQLLPGQALPSIYRAKKAIIVGDPHQMPPPKTTLIKNNNQEKEEDDELSNEQSMLDLAISLQSEEEHYLKVHYRSEKNMLFEPSRNAIYKEYGVQPIFEAGSNDEVPISVDDNIGEDDIPNFDRITEYIKSLYEKDNKSTFCLLFTNKNTFLKFENDYAPTISFYSKIDKQILVSTITNCQGLESDHSIIYLNHYDSVGSMWFFRASAGSYKRLNVSITRQRKSLKFFIADSKNIWLQQCSKIITNPSGEDDGRIKSAKLLQSVIEKGSYELNEKYVDDLLKNNAYKIDSPLTQQLYDMLCEYYKDILDKDIKIYCEVGWEMRVPDKENLSKHRKNVGFRIDLGIYSKIKKCFVLGIEMDGATYHSGYIKQFSDAQRQEILETKGWNIYRIWSTNWLNDIDTEFKKLVSKINSLI